MNKFILLFIFSTYINAVLSQTVTVTGQCMTGSIVLTQIPDIDGKTAFEGTGTVAGNAGVQVNVFWLPAPDNLWVLAFDGQPYFQNACNTTTPWGTGNGSCPWSQVSGQSCTGAAALSINVNGALPVNLTGFAARVNNNNVILNWKTTGEQGNKGFEIQRSTDGITWKNIGYVDADMNLANEKSYEFIDVNPQPGKSAYRIRQIDTDGKFSYSSIAAVQFLQSGFYSLARKTGSNIFQLNIAAMAEKVDLLVLDAGGKKLNFKSGVSGSQFIDIGKYPKGLYLLQIRKGNEMFTEKMIKF